MLQVDICPYASDALEDAMRLAQTKSLNSYTFSDCLSFLNYVWADVYSQICMIDSGYYSKTVQLKSKLTKIPKFVRNTVMVYAAQRPLDFARDVYRSSNNSDVLAPGTYHISGTDLYCPDAERTTIWCEYCPHPAQIFFTHHNRDPKLYPDGHDTERTSLYNIWKLVGDENVDVSDMSVTQDQIAAVNKWRLVHRNTMAGIPDNDITELIIHEPDKETGIWELRFISCDFPYIFCSYRNNITLEWKSGFFNKQLEWTDYNPFEWTGRNDNVEYVSVHYNDKTGLGAIVRDWNDFDEKLLNIEQLPDLKNSVIQVLNNFEYKGQDGSVTKFTQGYWFNRYATDFNFEKVEAVFEYPVDHDDGDVISLNNVLYRYTVENGWEEVQDIRKVAQKEITPRVKELGWTPDTKLVYPAPEVYRYLVARLAEKFSTLNESNVMGVQSELADARFAFQAFLRKDKSAWERMRNVNPAKASDWL